MERFDETMRERARSQDCPLPEGFEDRLAERLEKLPERTAAKRPHILRAALIAAALCLALVGTAFAAGALKIDGYGRIVLGRFAYGEVFDAEGNFAVPDPEKIASGEQTVVEPSDVAGAELREEDGRLILYYQYGPVEGREDVTDTVLEEGAYTMSGEQDGYRLSLTVLPCPEEDPADSDALFYQGAPYCLELSGKFPGGNYITHDEDGNETHCWHDGWSFGAKNTRSCFFNAFEGPDYHAE